MKPYKWLLAEHRYAEAAVLLEQQLKGARESQEKTEVLQTLLPLGVCYFETQRLTEARAVLEEALEVVRSESNEHALPVVLHELSLVINAQGHNERAIEICKEAVGLRLEKGEEPTLELHTLSVFYQEAERWDEAMELLEMVRESCEARGDLEGLGRCLNELGLTYQQKGDLVNAVKYLVDSIELKHRIGYERGIELSLRNLDVCLGKHPFAPLNPEVRRQLDRLKSILE
jgi:tetratricopeptide (TPR) repeat protein